MKALDSGVRGQEPPGAGGAVRGLCTLAGALLSSGTRVPCLSSRPAQTVWVGQGRGTCPLQTS